MFAPHSTLNEMVSVDGVGAAVVTYAGACAFSPPYGSATKNPTVAVSDTWAPYLSKTETTDVPYFTGRTVSVPVALRPLVPAVTAPPTTLVLNSSPLPASEIVTVCAADPGLANCKEIVLRLMGPVGGPCGCCCCPMDRAAAIKRKMTASAVTTVFIFALAAAMRLDNTLAYRLHQRYPLQQSPLR
jgi:hypothetical protein